MKSLYDYKPRSVFCYSFSMENIFFDLDKLLLLHSSGRQESRYDVFMFVNEEIFSFLMILTISSASLALFKWSKSLSAFLIVTLMLSEKI